MLTTLDRMLLPLLRGRRARVVVMALIVLLLALPAAVVDTQPWDHVTSVPPAFDRFLGAVRAATPPHARILVLDPYTDPHHYLYFRCLYALYPRGVVLQRVYATDVSGGRLLMAWPGLLHAARAQGAGYVLVWARPGAQVRDPWQWALPSGPQGALPVHTLRLRDGWGTLAGVTP